MPELPEVETIARELEAVLPNRRVLDVSVRLAKIVHVPLPTFRRRIVGATVRRVHRRAKLLLIDMSSGWTIIIHLKMSGQLVFRRSRTRLRWGREEELIVGGHPIPRGIEDLPNAYSHVVFTVTGGQLFFNDQRQFGYVKMIATKSLSDWFIVQGYGPEPLDPDFSVAHFLEVLENNKRKRIKPTLLDQNVIAGIGNIYADETCWLGRVRPSRRIASLTKTERTALYRGLRKILTLAIAKKGTTADAYRTATGDKGSMMPFLKVYGRDTKACKRCGSIIVKTVLAGRGTHYCSKCQR